MGLPAAERRYSIREYFQMEEKAEVRHEFHDGEILAMAGAAIITASSPSMPARYC
jgi:hypothetical protein